MRKRILMAALLFLAIRAPAQVTSFPSQAFTASGQTGTQIGLIGGQAIGPLSSGTISLIGTITTATFTVQGSNDGGATWFSLPTASVMAPSTLAMTQTATAPGMYLVSLAGLTNVRFSTSGTFTATGASIRLTGSSALGLLGRTTGGGGSGSGTVNAGSAGQPAYYASTGSAVSPVPSTCQFTANGLDNCALGQTTAEPYLAVASSSPIVLSGTGVGGTFLSESLPNLVGGQNGCKSFGGPSGALNSVNWCFNFSGNGFSTNLLTLAFQGGSPYFKWNALGEFTAAALGTGVSANSDLAGTFTLTTGQTAPATAYTFATTHATLPACHAWPINVTPAVVQSMSGLGDLITTTTYTFQIGTAVTATTAFKYTCTLFDN